MKVLTKLPGEKTKIGELAGYDEISDFVKGMVQAVPIPGNMYLICNEEGKVMDPPMPPNVYNPLVYGAIICGPIVVVGVGEDDWTDIPEEFIVKMIDILDKGGEIIYGH